MNNTNKKEQNNEILDEAITAFRNETNFEIEKELFYTITGNRKADAKLRLGVKGHMNKFLVEVKPTLNDPLVGRFAHTIADNIGTWLMVTRYVPPYLAKKMKYMGVQFIDTIGNAYINKPPLFVFTYGNKPPATLYDIGKQGIFGQAEVKVLFALLCKPELANRPYREIAHAANAALGTVTGVFKNLARKGYILELKGKNRNLVKKKELFEQWIDAYAGRLRHKTLIGRYTTEAIENWGEINLTNYGVLFGGETAAQRKTGYLKPEIVTLYARRPINELVLALKLRKKEDGNIEVRERFWEFDPAGDENTMLVPVYLIYADLIATANGRNIETAKMIYDEFIERHLGQD